MKNVPERFHAVITHGQVNEKCVPVQLHAIITCGKLDENRVPVQFHAIITHDKVDENRVPVRFHATFTCMWVARSLQDLTEGNTARREAKLQQKQRNERRSKQKMCKIKKPGQQIT